MAGTQPAAPAFDSLSSKLDFFRVFSFFFLATDRANQPQRDYVLVAWTCIVTFLSVVHSHSSG